MRMRCTKAVLVLVGTLAIVAAIRFLVSGADPVNVTTAEISSGDIVRRLMVSGTLQPARTVAIGRSASRHIG